MGVPQLVAIDLPGGPGFVDALRRTWDAGDVALPVDRRLPAAARAVLLASLAPDALLDATGRHALAHSRPTVAGAGELQPGDALVVATSGSTGTPKGVVLTHDAVRASAIATTRRLAISGDDTWLACLPLSHVGGLSVVTRAIVTGTRLVVHDGFNAAAVRRAALAGATAVSLVATAMARIDPTAFRVIVLGGSAPPADRPANAVVTYGLTETGSGIVYDGLPLDGVEVRIGAAGDVEVRGPMLMRAYRSLVHVTHPIDEEGWLATGDVGRWLPDGRLHIEGRRGDLVITGGENVWPAVVEAVLATHPTVAEVAVAGAPDEEWGQRVVAWVVPSGADAGGGPPSLAELRAHVADSLPTFMAPRELRVVHALPRTALGKVSRIHLPGLGGAAEYHRPA